MGTEHQEWEQESLIYEDDRSRKYWVAMIRSLKRVDAIEGIHYEVITAWGRVGSTGQTKAFPVSSLAAARSMMRTKLAEKRRKGYVTDPNPKKLFDGRRNRKSEPSPKVAEPPWDFATKFQRFASGKSH